MLGKYSKKAENTLHYGHAANIDISINIDLE